MTLNDELPRSVGTQYATGEEWRNNSRKNEETEPKQKQRSEERRVGLPKTDGSWWRVLTKCGPLEKGMANHFSILALRTP